jgi:fibronectin type 3 domain-containing protein
MPSKRRISIAARTIARRLFVERLEARQLLAAQPSVTTVTPSAGATGIALNMPVTAALNLPNGGIDPTTVTNATLTLVKTSNGATVPAVVNTTGGGDALILTPAVNLATNTQYTFTATAAIKDVNGDALTPFTETFTTGSTQPPINQTVAFQKVALPTAQGTPFTDMQIGPDGLLYASTEDGRIFRYVMNADGTLGLPQVITSLQTFEGGKRLITGFAFDPASTVTHPIIWVSNTFYALSGATNGPNFTSKLTVMSGPDLATVHDAIIDLPRSVADHVNDQPVFQPGTTNLFFCQAGQNAYGAPDTTWGNRAETLLSAAILEVNTTALNLSGPALNVLTPDVGGTYNPFASGAPLTIYATGIRNAYTLFFDDTGQLWAPINGSSAGGNTPAFPNSVNGNRIDTGQPYAGPAVPALNNVQQTEDDVLDKIVKGGYYGHPDPARGEFVLNDGNPTTGAVPGLAFTAYPAGTNPDPNYRLPNFIFGQHNSPDAMIEYTGNAFGGALNGKFLITEYSAGDDIVSLTRDASDNIASADRTISGFSQFQNPLAMIENPATGFLYVSELGGDRLTLLRPASVSPQISANKTVVPFNTISTGYSGAGPSRTETVTITNTGANPLTFGGGAFSIVNDPTTPANASNFTISNSGSLPSSLAAGASATINLVYSATAVGLQSAILQIQSNDPVTSTLSINLHGIGTPGQFGTAEPSLVQVLRAYNIPTIVGAGPDDTNINVQKYPANPDPSSEEVAMQRMVAAGPGPVTLTPIASFSANTAAVSRVGYYTPGDPLDSTELFYIGKADAQTVSPTAIGATSFDPGSSPFSLYGDFPGTTTINGTLGNTHYSEDAFNVLDPTNPRKIRFFPLKTADGTIVPNSYVVAMEDYDDPSTFNSFINFVGIISNVMPAPNAALGSTPSSPTGNNPPVLGVQENQAAPGAAALVFNTIQTPNPIAPDVVHNTNTITITNTGDQSLVVNSLVLSDTQNWALVNPPAPGTSIAAGNSLTVTIQFIATTDPSQASNETNDVTSESGVSAQAAGGVWTGTLTINSNDPINATRTINLAGYWQIQSEHENEPNVATLTNLLLGYTTSDTGSSSTQGTEFPNNGNTPITYGSEVDPSTNQGLLVAADPSQPVTLVEAASYHQQYITFTATDGAITFGIESASESGTTVTITLEGAAGFNAGDQVTIAVGQGVAGAPATYTGTFAITSVPTPTTFTYTAASSGLATYNTATTSPQSGWYAAGSSGSTHFLFRDQPNNGQSVFPLVMKDSFSTVQTSFSPSGAFGLNLDGMFSQDSLNSANLPFNNSGHSLRFWPVIDSTGKIIPNTWLVGMDYRNYATPNSDYQDLFEILSNATFEALPPTPIDLQASEGKSGVNLQWAAMTGATGYNVYQIVNGTSLLLNSSPIAATNFIDATAPAGSVVGYQVIAVNGAAQSLPASASINLGGAANGQTSPGPAAPTIQSADGSSGTQVVIQWSAPTGATSYILQREGPGQSTFTQIGGTLTATTYTDTNVIAGDTYVYRVEAMNGAGSSPFSTTASATVAIQQVTVPPPTPTNLHASVANGNSVILTWNGSGSATGYDVLREDPGSSTFAPIATALTDPTFTDSTVLAGMSYQYEVLARNSAGPSADSAPVTATLPGQGAPAAPGNVQAVASSDTSVVVTWDASAGAATYSIQRETTSSGTFSPLVAGLTTTTYTDSTVMPGQSYQYRVFAINSAGSSPASAAVTANVPAGGSNALDVTVGKGANRSVQFTAANGTLTTIRIAGRGTATVHFAAGAISQSLIHPGVVVVTGANIAVSSISTTGTSAANSVLLVTTRGGSKAVTIGGITADAGLSFISAATTNLIGPLSIAGSAKRILLGSVSAAAITIGGALGTLQVGAATGASLTSAGPIRSLIANTWSSNQLISASSINSINVKGDAKIDLVAGALRALHVRGSLHDSTITLSAAGTMDLALLTAGSIADTAIDSAGNLGAIVSATLDNSQIYAGTGITTLHAFPPLSSGFPTAAAINSVTLRKIRGVNSFVNSNLAASTIRHLSLGAVQFNNGGKAFGIEASLINLLSATDPSTGKAFAFATLNSNSQVAGDFAAKGITPQDFNIVIG